MYIYRQGKKWVIRKKIGNKQEYFGTFESLEEAEDYRDYCQEHDWSLDCKIIYDDSMKHIYKYANTYCVQKRINYKNYYYGRFHDLTQAKKYRDYCVQHNWSKDCMIKKEKPKFTKKNNPSFDSVDRRVARMFGLDLENLHHESV